MAQDGRRGVPGRPKAETAPYGAMTRLNVQLYPPQRRLLVEEALRSGRSVSDLIREAVGDWLEAHGYERGDGHADRMD